MRCELFPLHFQSDSSEMGSVDCPLVNPTDEFITVFYLATFSVNARGYKSSDFWYCVPCVHWDIFTVHHCHQTIIKCVVSYSTWVHSPLSSDQLKVGYSQWCRHTKLHLFIFLCLAYIFVQTSLTNTTLIISDPCFLLFRAWVNVLTTLHVNCSFEQAACYLNL